MAGFRSGSALAAAFAALLVAAPAGARQDEEPQPSVLLVMDASDSMNEEVGVAGTRVDAAKEAMLAAVEAVPDDARVGLRLYGHRLSGVSRRRACRDTELVVPVGVVDKPALTERIEGYEAQGRTPIARSLREAARDLADSPGRKQIVLVSDGGETCGPPSPCDVAREIADDVDLTISSVGFLVTERARAQLECVARVGGGSYHDATDPDDLIAELLALFSRAFRDYEPEGEPIEGGATEAEAAPVEPGQYLDSLSGAGDERWYAVELAAGERAWATATVVRPDTVEPDPGGALGIAGVVLTLVSPTDDSAALASGAFDAHGAQTVGRGASFTVRGEPAGSDEAGYEETGTYHVKLEIERIADYEAVEFPLELVVHRFTDPPARIPAEATPTPTPSPTQIAEPAPGPVEEDGGTPPALAAVAGLAVGAWVGGGLAFWRRRRRP